MFVRVKGKNLDLSSLWFELPGLTNSKVKELFGTGLASQDREKYSDSILIRSEMTNNLYSLYKCYGEWRVGKMAGVTPIQAEFDAKELGKLLT
jgi:hypothetical protein